MKKKVEKPWNGLHVYHTLRLYHKLYKRQFQVVSLKSRKPAHRSITFYGYTTAGSSVSVLSDTVRRHTPFTPTNQITPYRQSILLTCASLFYVTVLFTSPDYPPRNIAVICLFVTNYINSRQNKTMVLWDWVIIFEMSVFLHVCLRHLLTNRFFGRRDLSVFFPVY